jgi:hypothetical protein
VHSPGGSSVDDSQRFKNLRSARIFADPTTVDDGPHIHALEDRRPFAESVLRKLPDELLLHIVTYAITDARSLARVASVCSQLRNVVIGKKSLWADVDITRHLYKIHNWVPLCLSRAGADSSISMRAVLNTVRAYQAVESVSNRAEELDLQVTAGLDSSRDPFQMVGGMQLRPPNLRFLRLRGQVLTEWGDSIPALEIQRLLSCLIQADEGRPSSLALLVIHGGTVPKSLPSLSELVHLDLHRATLSEHLLYQVLQGSPKLETLSLRPNMMGPRASTSVAYLQAPSTQRLVLPHLRILKIIAPAKIAGAIMKVLPDPGLQLEITVVAGAYPLTNGPLASLDSTITRIHQYWTTVSGETCLPDGRLDVYWSQDEHTGTMTFGHANNTRSSSSQQHSSQCFIGIGGSDRSKPSLFFSTNYNLSEWHELLDEVRTVQIQSPSKIVGESGLGPGKQQLRLQESLDMYCVSELPRLGTLCIRNGVMSDDRTECHQVTKFLLGRQSRGFPAIAVQLQRCDGPWRQVVSQLRASVLVTSVTCT